MIDLPNASEEFKKLNPLVFGDSSGVVRPQTPNENQDSTPLKTKSDMNLERELASQIVNLLQLRGIEVLRNRTDKKSTATVGWPDLTMCVRVLKDPFVQHFPCLWEIKLPGRKLSPEQEALKPKLEANGWRYRIIHSVDEALKELSAMGIGST